MQVGSCRNRCHPLSHPQAGQLVPWSPDQPRQKCSCQLGICEASGSCCLDIATHCVKAAPPSPICTPELCDQSVFDEKRGVQCHCDSNCQANGDCCGGSDFNYARTCCPDPFARASCAGRCNDGGGKGRFSCGDGVVCYCDSSCLLSNDCCFDFKSTCGADANGRGGD